MDRSQLPNLCWSPSSTSPPLLLPPSLYLLPPPLSYLFPPPPHFSSLFFPPFSLSPFPLPSFLLRHPLHPLLPTSLPSSFLLGTSTTLVELYLSTQGGQELRTSLVKEHVLPADTPLYPHWAKVLPKMIDMVLRQLYPVAVYKVCIAHVQSTIITLFTLCSSAYVL